MRLITETRVKALFYKLSRKHEIHGISVAVDRTEDSDPTEEVLARLELALRLIRDHSPTRFKQIGRDLQCIFVTPSLTQTSARFHFATRMCELDLNYVLNEENSAVHVAACVVHEGQHARLVRQGILEKSARIERLCFRAAKCFALRISGADAEEVVREQEAFLTSDLSQYSPRAKYDVKSAAIEELRLPSIAKRYLRWRLKRAYVKQLLDPSSSRFK